MYLKKKKKKKEILNQWSLQEIFGLDVLDNGYNKKCFFLFIYRRTFFTNHKQINKSRKTSSNGQIIIITDHVLTCDFKTAILKSDLTDHFPIVIALKYVEPSQQH